MDKSRTGLGLAIMAGLIVLGVMLPVTASKLKSYDRTVNVKGLCEKEVKADKAIWPLVFKAVGNDLATVYSQMESNCAVIKEFLVKGGISENEISVSAPAISDKFAQEYGSNDRTFRYVAKTTVTVCTKDVDKVLALMSDQMSLVRKGITLESDWDARTEFSYESLNDIKPEMIEEATRNAREVAQKFAQDSESKLGKIKQASQGTFSIEDRDSNTPYIKKVRVVTSVVYYLKK
ncbi:MAG: SIMPL domain-containing protein [Bacteroidales bacterium]|nr:SIMPL domain-containing protein [Candidatus Cacconaster merdequi]